MECVTLTQAQRQAFEEDGFLVVPNALDPDTLEQVRAAANRLLVSFMYEPENHYLDLRREILEEAAIARLIAHPATVSLVVQLLGPNIHMLSTALFCKKPESETTPTRRGWHRDLRMPKDCGHATLPLIGIKVNYCLTDYPSADTGITKMIRKSHLRTSPLCIPRGSVDPPGEEIHDAIVRAGDAVLFDNRTYHSKAPNYGDSISKSVMFGYAYRWLKQEVYLDPPDPRLFENACPITRQLLGGYRDVDAAPRALTQWMETHGLPRKSVPWSVDEFGMATNPLLTMNRRKPDYD